MPHIFAEHGERGMKIWVVLGHVLELLDEHSSRLVLHRRFVEDVLVVDRTAQGGVEDLFLQRGMDPQQDAGAEHQGAHRFLAMAVQLLERPELLLHIVVVLLEHFQRVRAGAAAFCHGLFLSVGRDGATRVPQSGLAKASSGVPRNAL